MNIYIYIYIYIENSLCKIIQTIMVTTNNIKTKKKAKAKGINFCENKGVFRVYL